MVNPLKFLITYKIQVTILQSLNAFIAWLLFEKTLYRNSKVSFFHEPGGDFILIGNIKAP